MVGKFSDYLDKTKFVCGDIKLVNKEPREVSVVCDGKDEIIPYDFLVISLGTSYSSLPPNQSSHYFFHHYSRRRRSGSRNSWRIGGLFP
jgi:NADH dehydrogenase FAD-containing subunit